VLDWYLERYQGACPGALADPGRPPPAEGNRDDAILGELNRKVLVAASVWELRRVLYEVEEYLGRHPLSVDGRLLKDRIQTALDSALSGVLSPSSRPARRGKPPEPRRLWNMSGGWGFLVVLGLLLLLLSLLWRWLF
jgi:hypothetical protein